MWGGYRLLRGHASSPMAARAVDAGGTDRLVRLAAGAGVVSVLLAAVGASSALLSRLPSDLRAVAGSAHTSRGAAAPTAPISFEANAGQFNSDVAFAARTPTYTAYITPAEAALSLTGGALVHTYLAGANPAAVPAGSQQLPGHVNYFLGNDPRAWRTNVPTYAAVTELDVYPGVDLTYRTADGQLEYVFVVTPGHSASVIDLRIEGAAVSIDAAGDLVMRTAHGVMRQQAPLLYQDIAGTRVPVPGRFVLRGTRDIGFAVGAHDPGVALTIDPTIAYSTYVGGSGDEDVVSPTQFGFGDFGDIAVDGAGDAYLVGNTTSTDFPTAGAYQPANAGGADAYVTKLAADGSTVIYSTYLGGAGNEQGRGVALDAAGEAYVVGLTSSTNFPTVSPAQAANAGGNDGFVAKLSADGASLVFSTYLGGSGQDAENGVAVDASGSAYVAGETTSSDFPTLNAYQSSLRGVSSATVAKYSASGATVYSTYIGGTGTNSAANEGDRALGVAVDSTGSAYVTGTGTADFPTTPGAFQSGANAASCVGFIFGGCHVFVTKFDPTGSSLTYSTLIGGTSSETAHEIKLVPGCASSCNVYVAGETLSSDYPTTAGAFQTKCRCGFGSGMVSEVNATGSALIYSTYVHGPGFSIAEALAVDSAGDAWITGTTRSGQYPVTADATQPKKSPGAGKGLASYDAYLTELNPTGTGLVFSTFEGGKGEDIGEGLAIDSSSNVYLSGRTRSANFPVTSGAFQTTFGGGMSDAFVTKYTTP